MIYGNDKNRISFEGGKNVLNQKNIELCKYIRILSASAVFRKVKREDGRVKPKVLWEESIRFFHV